MGTFPVRIGGEIKAFDPHDFFPKEFIRRLDRYSLLGLVATRLALDDAHLPGKFDRSEASHACVRVGTVIGALAHAERTHSLFIEKGANRIPPFFSSLVLPSSLASQIGITCGVHGSVSTVIAACASGTVAVGEAFKLVREGNFDIAIAGASDAPLTPLVMASFSSIGLLADGSEDPTKACRPFSIDRRGIVLSEGSAILVLENLASAIKRGAKIYGEIVGYGDTFDAYHTHHPLPTAEQYARVMSEALCDASLRPEEVDYINPHGSGSIQGDKIETLAIKKAFGQHAFELPISSTKSMAGHSLGASGAVELVACALMLEHQFVHPTINLISKDPQCDLDFVPNIGRLQNIDIILSVSSGFGGYNAACLLRKYKD